MMLGIKELSITYIITIYYDIVAPNAMLVYYLHIIFCLFRRQARMAYLHLFCFDGDNSLMACPIQVGNDVID